MPRRSSRARAAKPPAGPALDAGVRLLGRRAHSRVELRRKLGRRGYVEEEIDSALARLVELGYVDDRSFADGYIRRRSGSLGPLALSAELAARGVDRSVADLALTAVDFEAQLGSATRLAERLCARNRPPGYRELLDSVGSKLLRRGFSLSIAREACRVAWVRTEGQAEA